MYARSLSGNVQSRVLFAVLIGVALVWSSLTTAQQSATESGSSAVGAPKGSVKRAQFTSLVTDREPVDDLLSTSTSLEKLFFFTELIDMNGKTMTHRWRYLDDVVAEIPFSIKGPRWRVFSYKTLQAGLEGEWTVELIDEVGNTYGEFAIQVGEAEQSTTLEPVAATVIERSSNQSSQANEEKLASVQQSITVSESVLDRIKTVFPDSAYTLLNDTLSNDVCPQSGYFAWQKTPNQIWTLAMRDQTYMRVHESASDDVALRPDPEYQTTPADCLVYSGHRFNRSAKELVTDLQADCEGDSRDVFSATSLSRYQDFVDLLIMGEQLQVCRYRLN